MPSERAKMLAGELYDASVPELVEERLRARRLVAAYNATDAGDREGRTRLLAELIGSLGEDVWIEPPFHCDYGSNITLGDSAYLNFNCVVLDCAAVEIGAGAQLAPAVQVYAATHPLSADARRDLREYALPVTIGPNTWIGGAAVILPGVSIGENSVIGAGSVVTRDVPSDVLAAGNPCRVIRELDAA
jgi:maltose O-acetyltransferase